jgi:hypothetical protein
MSAEELSKQLDLDNRMTWARLNAELYSLMTERMQDDGV